MPVYIYEHPKNGKRIEVVQSVRQEHTYVDEKGVRWNRVFTAPQVTEGSRLDPFSQNQFVEKTGKAKGTIGDIWDRARELSDKRASICGGTDPIRQKFFDEYSALRNGKRHPEDKRPQKPLIVKRKKK